MTNENVEHVMELCGPHHAARHEGLLAIDGGAEAELPFRLADGTLLGASGVGTRVTSSRVPAEPPSETPRSVPTPAPVEESAEARRKVTSPAVSERPAEGTRGSSQAPRREAPVREGLPTPPAEDSDAVAVGTLGPDANADERTLAALRATI